MAQRPDAGSLRRGTGRLRMPRPGRYWVLFITLAVVGLVLVLHAGFGIRLIPGPVGAEIARRATGAGGAGSVGALWTIVSAVLLASLLFLYSRALLHGAAKHGRTVEFVLPAYLASGAQGREPEEERIATALRERLALVHLSSPAPIPGSSADQSFIDEVRAAPAAQSGWGAFAALLLTALIPHRRSPYRVGLFFHRPRGGTSPESFIVEVHSPLTHDVAVETFPIIGGGEEAVRRAACFIAANILPHTKLSKEPPWAPWHGSKIDSELFYQFNEARRLVDEGRLEEAIEHFDRAAAADPLNPYIRLEKAQALEQLGLYVRALSLYVDVVAMESWYDRPLWRRFRRSFGDGRAFAERPPSGSRSPSQGAALQLARYRMVCSLADAERLAEDWQKARREDAAGGPTARLRPMLGPYGREVKRAYLTMMARWRRGDCAGRFDEPKEVEGDPRVLSLVLQYMALAEARQLERDYRGWRWRYLRNCRQLIRPPAIRVLPDWAGIQFLQLEGRLEGSGVFESGPESGRRRHPPGLPFAREWFSPRDGVRYLRRLVGATALRRPILRMRTDWLAHYNAACAFAVSMKGESSSWAPSGPLDRRSLARLAVSHLSLAVIAPCSPLASGKAAWLTWGDRDLDMLRVTPEFRSFAARYLPTAPPGRHVPPPPSHALQLIMTGHYVHLLEGCARARKERLGEGWNPQEEREWRKALVDFCGRRDDCAGYEDLGVREALVRLARGADGFDSSIPDLAGDGWWSDLACGALASAEEKKAEQGLSADRYIGELAEALDRDAAKVVAMRRRHLEALGSWVTSGRPVEGIGRRGAREQWAAIETWMRELRCKETNAERAKEDVERAFRRAGPFPSWGSRVRGWSEGIPL